MRKEENWFKYVSFVEGISYLILMGIAMPIKYIGGIESAVAIPGMIHGVLFMLFCVVLLYVGIECKWGIKKMLIGFVSSIIPFGPWIFHKHYMVNQ
jgi:integral membrane protein